MLTRHTISQVLYFIRYISLTLRKLSESIQKLREGLYDYARQENEFRETVDAMSIVKDEIHKK